MSFGGSLFGGGASSTTTPAQSTGGIGSIFTNAANAANASKPATPSLFGTANTSATPAAAPSAGGLFGNAQSSTTPAITLQPPGTSAPTTSLFGNSNTANTNNASAPAAGGGLFGNANAAATPAPALGGGLFGNATPASSAPSGGLFGNANAANAAPFGGLSGSSTTANAAPAAGGLFGASTAAAQPAQSTNLFGSAQPASNAGGLFGASANNANNTQPNNTYKPLFGSLGAATTQQPQQANQSQQQSQVIQGVRIDLSNVKPTTRFYELHESLQNEIIQADDFIQSQINLITQCNVFIPAHGASLSTLAPDVKFVHNTLDTVALALGGDAAEINAVKSTVKQDIEDCTRAFTAIEHLKLPAPWQYSSQIWGAVGAGDSSGTGGAGSGGVGSDGENAFAATDMVPYFDRQTAELDARLKEYKSQLAEIEAHLRTVEASAVEQMHKLLQQQAGNGGDQERGQIAELASAMHVFEEAVLRVAGKVGETREGVIECTLGRLYGNSSARR